MHFVSSKISNPLPFQTSQTRGEQPPGPNETADRTRKVPEQEALIKVNVVDEGLVSKCCVVRYDGRPYPGVILTVDDDEEVEVQVMHSIGKNRYFWPMIDDAVWYREENVVSLLQDPPKPVTKRHCEIDKRVWRLIEPEMDLD